MTSISGYAEIIKDGIADSDHIKDFAGRIFDESTRLMALIDDIIKISKLDETTINNDKANEQNETHNTIVNMNSLVEKVINRLTLPAVKKNISVEFIEEKSSETENTEIFGNETILEEMIYNLCENAIKYNKENGSVKISIFEIENINNTKSVAISVEDTGIGIPKSEQENVFQRFYRVVNNSYKYYHNKDLKSLIKIPERA